MAMNIYKKECPYCKRIIEGTSEHQVEINLISHKINAHRDKVEIVEKKDAKNKRGERSMRTKNMFDVVDEQGKIIQSFRNKICAERKANKLNMEMFGAKFEVRRKDESKTIQEKI